MSEYQRKNLLIIPTHAHPHTVPYAIKSAQNQTITDLDIVVIGDGVTDETRAAVEPFLVDERVRFLDKPKAIRHGEEYRDYVIRNSSAETVSYLGDDDLLFPSHLQLMGEHLSGVDFVNPLPIFINFDGSIHYIPTDLANPDSLLWHLDEQVHRNSVSLTGVMHTRESYLRLPFGWRPAPLGRWTDHYMWQQYFQLEGFQAKTLPISTTAKFGDVVRSNIEPHLRVREIESYVQGFSRPEFIENWNHLVREVVRAKSVEQLIELQIVHSEKERLISEIQDQVEKNSEISQELNRVLNTKSWRLTNPLRQFRGLFK